jgi:hypothetical protein
MFNRNDFALLHFELNETVQAFILWNFVGIIHDLYSSHLWLDLAEKSLQPFPENYSPIADDSLYIFRLEIGSPNFIEFFGQAPDLFRVFEHIGEMMGIFASAKATVSIAKDVFDIRKAHIDTQKTKLDTQKIKLELERLKAQNRFENKEVDVDIRDADLALRAQSMENKMSSSELDRKLRISRHIADMTRVLFPTFGRKPRLLVLKKEIHVR